VGYAGRSAAGVVTKAGLASAEKTDKEHPIMREYEKLLRRTVHLPCGEPKPKLGPPGWRMGMRLISLFWRKC
jgi:hypothetical protein